MRQCRKMDDCVRTRNRLYQTSFIFQRYDDGLDTQALENARVTRRTNHCTNTQTAITQCFCDMRPDESGRTGDQYFPHCHDMTSKLRAETAKGNGPKPSPDLP
jgi:hypothetical protein